MLVLSDAVRQVHTLKLGALGTNCYIIVVPGSSFVIDPVGEASIIIDYLLQNRIRPDFCVVTHAHFDHIGAAAELIEAGLARTLFIHPGDRVELTRCRTYAHIIAKKKITLPSKDKISWFDGNTEEFLGKLGFGFHHFPSHTPGSCILYTLDRKLLFSGDIIIHNFIPHLRTALGESKEGLRKAFDFIASFFPNRTIIFPGHGKLSLVETEMNCNPKIRSIRSRR